MIGLTNIKEEIVNLIIHLLLSNNQNKKLNNDMLHSVITGSPGCGKTTFFKLASGQISPTSGYIVKDDRLRVGYYNQQIVDNLPLQLNSIQYLQQLNPKLDSNSCRNILGKSQQEVVEEIEHHERQRRERRGTH